MSGFSIEQLKFDPAGADDTHNVGAYVRSSDGTLITHTTDGSKERLDVATGAEYAEGTAFAGGERGMFMLAVNDSGDYAPLRVTDAGELKVDVQVTSGSDKEEDTAHADGAVGTYTLSVRQDALAASTSADGDYQSFKTDNVGALWVRSYKAAMPTHSTKTANEVSVTDAATAIPTTALTDRKKIIVQNKDSKDPVTLGWTNGITFGTGPVLSPGSSLTLEIDAGSTLYGICSTGNAAIVAYFELGA